MIRPDIPCWVVLCANHPEWVGRVVWTGRRKWALGYSPDGWIWETFAHWLPSYVACWYAPSHCLQPLYGPDVALDVALEQALPV